MLMTQFRAWLLTFLANELHLSVIIVRAMGESSYVPQCQLGHSMTVQQAMNAKNTRLLAVS